jgi:hypothetical protein
MSKHAPRTTAVAGAVSELDFGLTEMKAAAIHSESRSRLLRRAR